MRRLGRVIGQCEALTPAPNVGGTKPHKGRRPTAVLWNPGGREAPGTHTDLLGEVACFVLHFFHLTYF
jgi:hypothetical protein